MVQGFLWCLCPVHFSGRFWKFSSLVSASSLSDRDDSSFPLFILPSSAKDILNPKNTVIAIITIATINHRVFVTALLFVISISYPLSTNILTNAVTE